MDEVSRIVEQMELAHVGDSWTGVSISGLLGDVSHEKAAARPIPNAHTIWELLLHLIATQELILDLAHGVSRSYEPDTEWPTVGETSEDAWADAVERFTIGETRVRHVVSDEVSSEQLDQPFCEGGTSAYNNLHGYVQHAFYHGGQMSLLKKLLA
jgi:uncharacterized damage-inducible protein DinB